jgi:hypothetical protein
MDQNTFFTLFNIICAALIIAVFYPIFKVKDMADLNEVLHTRPLLSKAVARKGSRSYIRSSIYFTISLIAYWATAIGGDIDGDMGSALLALIVLFVVMLARTWKLRKLLGAPATRIPARQ